MTRKRQVDELGVRRVLKAFDEAHPEGLQAKPPTMSQLNQALGGKPIGRPPSDDPTVPVRIGRQLLAELDAARGDRTRQDVLREAVQRWLRRERRR